jgi:hypothetical protein
MKHKYNLGQLVYLVTDDEQKDRLVIAIKFTIDGGLVYTLSCGTNDTSHYEAEISETRNIIKALSIN